MSMNKSNLVTHLYLPSVISRWQAHHIPHKSQHGQFQADIIASAADDEDAFHILSCLPTGYGKSLPMLLLSLFLPQGMTIEYTHWIYTLYRPRPTGFQCRFNYCNRGATDFHWGPTKDGVLSTWLVCCCWRPGGLVTHWSCLKYQSSIKVGLEDMRKELLKRPHILICSAEFLSSEEVNPGHHLQPTTQQWVLISGTFIQMVSHVVSLTPFWNVRIRRMNFSI